MTTPEPQASGDYGYDLAHEQPARGPAPAARSGPERPGRGSPPAVPVGGADDAGEDYGYDEAHDF